MMGRGSRLALWGLALLLSVLLYWKGRAPLPGGKDAAFPFAGGGVPVRLAGDFPSPGVYRFADGIFVTTVVKMTLPDLPFPAADKAVGELRLHGGEIVCLARRGGQPAVISVEAMGAKERMLLGIPLDPDRLTVADWDLLPGIGPRLAERIVADRLKNGAFGSVTGVLRVSGIGPAKLEAIRRYF
jgi:competence protein ComEA